jgi:SAM-dependent methyltransferase
MQRNAFYYEDDHRYMRFLVPAGSRVLELGCGTGHLLAALRPSYGVGVDISQGMVDVARAEHPTLEFHVGDMEDPDLLEKLGGPFDAIVISDAIGHMRDCQRTFDQLHAVCTPDTRIIVAYFSQLWRPVLKLAELTGQKMRVPTQNWMAPEDVESLLELADFEPIKREWRLLIPKRLAGLGPLVNRTIGTLPLFRRLSLRHYVVARPARVLDRGELSATVLVPCRNEAGNIEPAVQRIPQFSKDLEILFVEGNSSDDTVERIHQVIADYPDRNIRFLQQTGRGKGDAVRKGFEAATGDVLMILDADLTVPPEELPKFFELIRSGKADYVHGTRLVYPMESNAMRPLNLAGNHAFARIFTWLLNQRITDTLCGTKVLLKRDYERLVANRSYFGDFDPFGDFDLIFGASKLNLKIVELPVRYAERIYGSTQISRFRDGLLLLRMVVFAFRKLKAV